MNLILVFVAMVAIMAWIIKDARPVWHGTVMHAHRFAFLRRYDTDQTLGPLLLIAALAVGTLIDASLVVSAALSSGVVLGVCCAGLWAIGARSAVRVGLAGICLAASGVGIIRLHENRSGDGFQGIADPYVLLGVLTICYLGAAFLVHGAKVLSVNRAAVYFAVIDFLIFLTSPGGVGLGGLSPWRQALYVLVACAACAVFGVADLDIVVFLAAAAVTVADVLLQPPGEYGAKPSVLIGVVIGALLVRGLKKLRAVR